jgi:DNA-binding GntR family transcriptional regulator
MATPADGATEVGWNLGLPVPETQSALARVVTALEEDIVFGRLHQRERLVEDDLLQRFDVKRHVIRQAFVELERMGLVERIPNRGASVRSVSAETVNHLYVVRELLEAQAARLIPLPVRAADLESLKGVQRIHDRATKEQDLRLAFRSNIEFHRRFFALCQNPVLAAAINDFAYRTHAIRFYSITNPVYLKRANEEHHKMIRALKQGDRTELVELCRNHLLPAKRLYLQAAAQHAMPSVRE